MANIQEEQGALNGPQPNWILISQCLQSITNQTALMPNVPAFGRDNLIANLNQLSQDVGALQAGHTALQQNLAPLEIAQDTLEKNQDSLKKNLASTLQNVQNTLEERLDALEQQQNALKEGNAVLGQTLNIHLALERNLRTEISCREKNSIARVVNSTATRHFTALDPFYDKNGELVPNFPATLGAARQLTEANAIALLTALGLSQTEAEQNGKAGFEKYIGLLHEG